METVRRRLFAPTCWAALVSWSWLFTSSTPAADIVFNRDVRPILAENCFTCHGPDGSHREADLRLDEEASATANREGTPAIVRGRPEESELLRRLTTDDPELRMPPASTGKTLTAKQIEVLRQWITQGAPWQKHWALIPPVRPAVPNVSATDWPDNMIDRWILHTLEGASLAPADEADRRTLIRRLTFDLTGLPPSPEEVESFVADPAPDAFEKRVDRLLASPHFGERMAVYWLDVVRYADSGGYHSDNERSVWPYRDYVIGAFNAAKPFDVFTAEQLAGDLLPEAGREQRIASGYNRLVLTTEEGGAQPKEYATKYQADRVRNAASVWLAITLGCCECHDHKYDPFSSRDFYRLAAFFSDVQEKPVGRQEETPIATCEQEAELAGLDAKLASLREVANQADGQPGTDAAGRKAQIEQLQKQRESLVSAFPRTLVSVSVTPRTVRILPRGNWLDESGEVVEPGVPAELSRGASGGERASRLDLARWLASPENPLTARVFVNRLWKLCFGQGLVKTADDFGVQGEWPSHPELLDWLAIEFRDRGWDVKSLVKEIVMSRAYRLSSNASSELRERDPANRLLARQSRFRLDAEFLRDQALSASGLLERRLGGPSVKPYQPAGYWRYLNFPTRDWKDDHGPNQYRRGLYTHWQRTFLHPSLAAFDAPSREECTVDRARSNTPLQALVLLNDPTFVEGARVLAARVLESGGGSDESRLDFLFRQSLQRQPATLERTVLLELLRKHRTQYAADPPSAESLLAVGQSPRSENSADPAELAAWTSVARAVFNVHEMVTRL